MSSYDALIDYLERQTEQSIALSFAEIEALIKRSLPNSASKYAAFWSKGNHLGRLLLAVGWEASLQARGRQVVFRHVESPARQTGSPPVDRTTPSPLAQTSTSRPTAPPPAEQTLTPDIVLVGCVKSKRDGRHRAVDLYTSALFFGRAEHARSTGKPWFILSAKHGLLAPGDVVGTYDVALKNLPVRDRRAWSKLVLEQIDDRIGPIQGEVVEIHAGKAYCDFGLVDGLKQRGAHVTVPLAHLRQGEQLRWYSGHTADQRRSPAATRIPSGNSGTQRHSTSPVGSGRVRKIVAQLTTEFFEGDFDLRSRPKAPACGWDGIPEVKMARRLRNGGVTDIELRIILTLGVAMDRARDADRLWLYVMRLWRDNPWTFDPKALAAIDPATLREVLAETGVSQRHGKDCLAWQRIGAALVDPDPPTAFREVVYGGRAGYGDLLSALQARRSDGEPWFPLLRGPKISLVWLRMLVVPGGADITGIEDMPVAVDVQVRKATEYLGVTNTSGLPLADTKDEIQRAWHKAADCAAGPGALAGTASALDPAIWFFAKWGCTYCEGIGTRAPISSVCTACRFDFLKGVKSRLAKSVRRQRC